MNKNDISAFPVDLQTAKQNDDGYWYSNNGMTLRDYFAAKAMAICFSARDRQCNPDAAKWAYDVADAMLNERLKTK